MAVHHHLRATPKTVVWGRFGAAIPPVLEINSGDTVRIETLTGTKETVPGESLGFHVPPSLREIHEAPLPFRLGHLLTGPIAITGAAPGDILEVQIEDVTLDADWGFSAIEPFFGTLPDDFIVSEPVILHIPIDRTARTAQLPWGPSLTLSPFFGVMGLAPPPEYGEISSREPRKHGGNIDNRHLGAGTTLFLPVWADGALFTCGDGHGVQGDGEVCITALETALTGTFRFKLHRQPARPLKLPRAETPSHLISMGFHQTLDEALRIALREMIEMVVERQNCTRMEAYRLCSMVADFAVTQSVNVEKGVHGMLAKSLLDLPGAAK